MGGLLVVLGLSWEVWRSKNTEQLTNTHKQTKLNDDNVV